MNIDSSQDLSAVMDVLNIREKQQRAFSLLLGELNKQTGHHLVCRVRMGEISSYLTSVRLRWVTDKIGFAADLPLFRQTSTGSRRVAIGDDSVRLIQQRQPDWRRQLSMAAYLAICRNHKFPPLLLVGYQGWVYERDHEKWGIDGRAEEDSITHVELDLAGAYSDLDDSDTSFYALDGQHRLMAILGLRDLITNGQIEAFDKERKVKAGKGLKREDIIEYIHVHTGEDPSDIHERIQRLMDERIGVEIVPAVCRGETYEEAVQRLRQMFVDVNENAKRLTASEIALLDETNGYRVVARRLLESEDVDLLDTTKVDLSNTTVSEKSRYFTTLKSLVDIVKLYLKHNVTLPNNQKYRSWDNMLAKGVSVRPEQSELDQGRQDMIEYFHQIETLPSHIEFIQGKQASELRSKSGLDNILFRPLAQTALAEALGRLATQGVSVESAIETLRERERKGDLRLTKRNSPWFGVLSDPATDKMRRHKRYEELSCRMFQYLLGGGIEDDVDRAELRSDFASARQIDPEGEQAINLQGDTVGTSEVRLPHPWR